MVASYRRGLVASGPSVVSGATLPPALCLYGPRGTGKTTVARILSRALNCESESPDGEPCCTCQSCLAIARGTDPGVHELDMASHGSVDDIRRLASAVAFSLGSAWRVYLMDEVHSASRDAFNALLKILEEPPPRVLFLLVTTEQDKIPETIRSRALDFEFRRISSAHIVDRLREVAGLHDLTDRLDDEVYPLLAARARGGMRDAVMSLQQLSYLEGRVDADAARNAFGMSVLPEQLLDAALKGDLRRCFQLLHGAPGASPSMLIDAMVDGVVGLLAASQGTEPDPGRPITTSWIASHAPGLTPSILYAGLRVLWDIRGRFSAGNSSAASSTLYAGLPLLVSALAPSVFGPGAPAHGAHTPLAPYRAAPTPRPPSNGTQAATPEAPLGPEELAAFIAQLGSPKT